MYGGGTGTYTSERGLQIDFNYVSQTKFLLSLLMWATPIVKLDLPGKITRKLFFPR